MPTSVNAQLSFLPWVRQGAAAAITTVDTLGSNQRGAAELAAVLSVNDAQAPSVPVHLRGPADVVGIDANQIVRTDPRSGSSDFEPNYFPCIEFDHADFPWLFTPARADGNARLRPWLCLIVVRKQDGVSIGHQVGVPLAVLQIAAPAQPGEELPDLRECWAWAHAQTASDANAAQVGAALNGSPERSLSRLLCPRRLAPNTDYIACVVPTFELGRKAGLGLPIQDSEIKANNALTPAWSLTPAPTQLQLPVYHHWQFRTGLDADFESMVRALRPRPVPAGLGRRPIDIGRPGFQLPADFPSEITLGIEGALQPMDSPDAPEPWLSETATPFRTALAQIVNTPSQQQAADPDADPLLAPPLYGRWHAARNAAALHATTWFDQLNLDPRYRSIAAFGTRVVQEHQEALMAAAWEQAAELQHVNQRLRQLQLSLAVGTSLHARHFSRLPAEAVLRIGAPAFGRLRAETSGDSVARALTTRVTNSILPPAAASVAMRRIGRERGPLSRRTERQGAPRSGTTTWVNALNLANNAFLAYPVLDFATMTSIRQRFSNVTRHYPDVTAALLASHPTRPYFGVEIEGTFLQQHSMWFWAQGGQGQDSPAASAFRTAAREHLSRINPGRTGFLTAPAPPLPINDISQGVLAQTEPRRALTALVRAAVSTGANTSAPVPPSGALADSAGIDIVMAAPTFRQPMYERLRDLSSELLLPGLEAVLPESVIGLKTNRRFVEAYLVGLNFEMGRELLWRGFPTDQRGTCFKQFWDTSGATAPKEDITPLHQWGERTLGDAVGAPVHNQFVMLLRSTLLRRYPNAVIYAVPAVMVNHKRVPNPSPGAEIAPAFSGSLPPDVSFFGFDLSAAQITGSSSGLGYYIVIQEHPTEPRFGLDVGTPTGGGTHVSIAAGPPAGLPLNGLQWGFNAAHTAGIVRQLPVRIAIYAPLLLPA